MSTGEIQSIGAILNYLVQSDGWAPWSDVVAHVKISDDFGVLQRLLVSLQSHDRSFTGKHPDKIQAVFYGNNHSNNHLMRFKIKYIIVIWLSNTCSAGLNAKYFQYFHCQNISNICCIELFLLFIDFTIIII